MTAYDNNAINDWASDITDAIESADDTEYASARDGLTAILQLVNAQKREITKMKAALEHLRLRDFAEWHEDFHDCVWHFVNDEGRAFEAPSYVGTPLSDDWPFDENDEKSLAFTPIPAVCPRTTRNPLVD